MEPVKERVVQHLKLAQIIASKYFNIPEITREEVISEAQTALVRASAAYDPSKGPFPPFAGTVIRNALNSLYQKQLKHVKMMAKSLDETINGGTAFGTYIGNLSQNIKDSKKNVLKEVILNEDIKKIREVTRCLSEQEKEIVISVAKKMPLSEIAKKFGVSRQAIFKKWKIIQKKLIIKLDKQKNNRLQ